MIKPTTLCVCLGMLLSLFAHSQTFDGTGGFIADDNTLSDFTIEVSDLTPGVLTPEHGLVRVCINLTHTWVSDLDIRLIAPDGTNIMLTATKGDDLDNYDNTCFDMAATQHIVAAEWPYTGDFKPYSSLGNVNNGQSAIGTWTLRIWDQFAFADGGELLSWSLTFGDNAASPFVFDSSSLPIILINTNNITIPNDPKISGTIKVIDGDSGFNHLSDSASFESYLGIETRGSSSQNFPKKSFGFETQDEFGEDLETELLGLPKEEDWILYAPYTDKSMMRDALTYQLGRDLGKYAPRTVFVELFLNGDYHGVYALEEKIKRDKNRVNITKLDPEDIMGDDLTGGYLLKVDRDDGEGTYFVSNYEGTYDTEEVRIVYEDPEGGDLVPEQIDYIKNYFNRFEDALYGQTFTDPVHGYRGYIDVSSFVDFFLINELGHNVDGYRLSSFLYKDKNSKDSLFHMGPLWDFNLAYGNVNYCECERVDGWAYQHSGACGNTPRWWNRLVEDPAFLNDVKCRWDELRAGPLHRDTIFAYLDEQAAQLGKADERNYERWPIIGVYIWPNHFIGNSYAQEMEYLQDWLTGRLNWLDDNITGDCIQVGVEENLATGYLISPNPAGDFFKINSLENKKVEGRMTLSDITGRVVMSTVDLDGEINISVLPAGAYSVRVELRDGSMVMEKVVKM